ncbi:hypothetical protein B0T20DRAFT_494693 [Sordaria brevicollis]|uniref:Uncharacterized protein n=1 Tax=Sordaria brevicollis TaxID=83679 RepID=A0AAE0UE42_SORBR|nr:hypothetical protein B0T20DRAFT_494693 [Sordaria brevicollis]
MTTEGIGGWCSSVMANFKMLGTQPRNARYDPDQMGEDSEDDEQAQLNRQSLKRCEYETGDSSLPGKGRRLWTLIVLLLTAVTGAALFSHVLTRRSVCHHISSPTRHQSEPHSSSTTTATTTHHGHGHGIEDNRPSHKNEVKQCGSSPSEAQARGCIFEQQLAAWVPRVCAFPDVVEEYKENFGDMMADWTWYWDSNATMEVPPEAVPDLQTGNFSVVYTRYQASHDLHCLYCSRKIIYALSKGIGMMDARCHQFYHGAHCIQHIGNSLIMAEKGEEKKMQTWVYPLMYHNCVPLTSTQES